MEWFSLIVFSIYMGVLYHLIKSKHTLQYYTSQIRFTLLTYWFKVISVGWIIVVLISTMLFRELLVNWEELTLININLALFVFLFSKQNVEDEFSEQIRLKSFTYSFVSFVALFSTFNALEIGNSGKDSLWDSFTCHYY
jgi:hypothetical protein